MKRSKNTIYSALCFTAIFFGSNAAYAGYAVAASARNGVMGHVGNTEQSLAVLSQRAVVECENHGGQDCQVICAGAAGGYVAYARGRNPETNLIGLGCSQQDSREEAKSEAITECSQVGGEACQVVKTFEAK